MALTKKILCSQRKDHGVQIDTTQQILKDLIDTIFYITFRISKFLNISEHYFENNTSRMLLGFICRTSKLCYLRYLKNNAIDNPVFFKKKKKCYNSTIRYNMRNNVIIYLRFSVLNSYLILISVAKK